MTARTDAQQAHERFIAAVLELDLDYCNNTFGVSPCTAGRKNSGTAQAGSASTITLATGASAVDNAYTNMVVRITGGAGSGQERTISGYVGATKVATVSQNWTTNPDATSTYDVIDRPNACYNVYIGPSPCQDKANYAKGTKTYKFCTRGMRIPAGEIIRPYIDSLSMSPTEIDPRGGLARSSRTQLRLLDEPADDHHEDKYAANRATAAVGTFWSRLIARNPNNVGRWARIRMGYVVTPWDWNTFQSELYVIDSIKGPSGRGEVTVQLKDPIKLADNTKVPTPTDGKLAAAITASETVSFTVDSGKGSQYGASGRVRIGDEVLSFASRTGDTLSTLVRGLDGTTAAAHSQNDKVQLCKVYSAALLTDVIKDLLNASSITNTYIDTAQMTDEDTRWLSTKYQITKTLTEPEKPSDLIAELVRDANAFLWWHPTEQKFKFKVNMPESPTTTPPTFTDTANLMENSVQVDVIDAERITYSSMNYALLSATANKSEDKNYMRGAIYIDADAEGGNEYNDRRAEVRRSRFLGAANDLAATAFVSRDVSWRRDAPLKIKFNLDPRDYTIGVGQLVDLDTKYLTDAAGKNRVTRVRVMRLVDKGTHIECEARSTKFRNRYGFIAPNGTADYPTDQMWAHICRSTPSQTMGNGDDPYLII